MMLLILMPHLFIFAAAMPLYFCCRRAAFDAIFADEFRRRHAIALMLPRHAAADVSISISSRFAAFIDFFAAFFLRCYAPRRRHADALFSDDATLD